MTDYILWQQGLTRPYPVLLPGRSPLYLTEHERRAKVGDAMEVKAEHAAIGYLDELAKHYPCPGSPREHLMREYHGQLAIAAAPNSTDVERAVAQAKARQLWEKMGSEAT